MWIYWYGQQHITYSCYRQNWNSLQRISDVLHLHPAGCINPHRYDSCSRIHASVDDLIHTLYYASYAQALGCSRQAWPIKKCSICGAHGLCKATRSTSKPANFDRFIAAQMPRTQDLGIFMLTTEDRQTKPIALPLAHSHRQGKYKGSLPVMISQSSCRTFIKEN